MYTRGGERNIWFLKSKVVAEQGLTYTTGWLIRHPTGQTPIVSPTTRNAYVKQWADQSGWTAELAAASAYMQAVGYGTHMYAP